MLAYVLFILLSFGVLDIFRQRSLFSTSHTERTLPSWITGLRTPASVFYLCAVALLATATVVSFRAVMPATTVELPIEVFPPDGSSPHVESVMVDITDPSGIDHLFLKGHHLGYHKSDYADQNGYDQKASVRINGGSWTPISNATSTCRFPEEQYECIGGPYNTLRLEVDATQSGDWTSGNNLIEFRFNGTEGISSGYRILELDVLAGSESRLGETTFTKDDPDSWSPTLTDPDSLSDGKSLFQERDILLESPDGPQIVASCADCHARDGRDLWYYNFSSRSIQARARYHGLSQSKAVKISSWIRSLPDGPDGDRFDLPSGVTVGDLGRPWNPPYQPGPNIDDRPVEQWAAGAGLEWVLDSDQETKQYLFPNGLNGSEAESIASTETTLNVREIPIAVPLPDILEWWPDYHPLDVYGESTFLNSEIWSKYQDILTLEDPTVRQNEIDAAANGSRRWSGIRSYFDDFHRGGTSLTMQSRFANDFALGRLAAMSFQQWQLMKNWEAMHRYDLEDIAPTILPGRTDEIRDDRSTVPGGEKYQWFHQNQIPWWVAPHMNARPDYPEDAPYPTPEQNSFFSHTWYQLQMTLNAGSRWPNGNKPMDWKYHFGHLPNTMSEYGVAGGWRYTLGYLKMIEMYDTGKSIDGSSWFIRHSHPRWMFFTYKGRGEMWTAMGSDYLRVLELITQSFLETSINYADSTPESDTYGADAWPRGESSTDVGIEEVEPESHVPSFENGYHHSDYKANGFYLMADDLSSRGADPQVIDQLARWGEAMWSEGNWEQWFQSTSTSSQNISLNRGWNLISSSLSPSDNSISSIFSDVESDLAVVQNQQGDAYDPTSSNNTLDTWDDSQGYRVYMTSEQTMSIDGTALESPSLSLEQGWNLIPYYPSSEMPVADAFASISDEVDVVKDQAGNSYIPARDLNEIGSLMPGQAYKVYVNTATTFSYP